ncbi:Aste57867_11084 [Aphanomyces stellatus]|uniref:Aste57867_11084 protein n=1 Tax=Aphanomyces stellatus TaxID=120398 RepID=A0A485KRY6_9STRA|nr:hypothetical protein As57867_011042 [Aphanomyces stellatus]VFT87951.1 Aste57867_11084 [Aphanomyces stellatus]
MKKAKKREGKSAVRRIRDELSRKVAREDIWSVSNQSHAAVASRNQLYHAHLEFSLKQHFRPSLLRLDAAAPVSRGVIYESAKVDASLKLAQQLYMLEFAFRKFAFRWRKIKLESGLHLWQTNVQLLLAYLEHQKQRTRHAVKIQRAYRRKRRRDANAAAEKSFAMRILEIMEEQARKKQRELLETSMATRVQSHWRGFSVRVTWHCLLQHRLRRALDALATHQVFGSIADVQIAGGALYATSDADIHTIRTAHVWLATRAPPFATAARLACIVQVEDVGRRRVRVGGAVREKQRHTYWTMLAKQVDEMSVAEARIVRMRARGLERVRAREARQVRAADELRGVRNLLSWQEARQRHERVEMEKMAAEEGAARAYLKELAKDEAKLHANSVKRSVALLKHAMRTQLDDQEKATDERRRMRIEEVAQRLARSGDEAASTCTATRGMWTTVVGCRVDTNVRPVAAVEVTLCVTTATSKTAIVHQVSNAGDLRRGLWCRLDRALLLLPFHSMPQKDAVYREARRVGHAHEWLVVRLHHHASDVQIAASRTQGPHVSSLSLACPIVAILALLQADQMVWLRPRNIHRLMEWIASRVAWIPPGRLVLVPPVDLGTVEQRPCSAIPAINTLLQQGIQDLDDRIAALKPRWRETCTDTIECTE